MGEEISQLVDGELDALHVERVCTRLAEGKSLETWVAYHLIGDALRQGADFSPGFHERFRARLAAEPTVLAPQAKAHRPAYLAWAMAASIAAVAVVGWLGLREFQTPAVAPVAQAPLAEKGAVAAARSVQQAGLNDYLMVHQAYSPATALQGARPYLRAASESGQEAR